MSCPCEKSIASTSKLMLELEFEVKLWLFFLDQGVGPPLSTTHTRMLFALRINVLAKGYRLVQLVHLWHVFRINYLPNWRQISTTIHQH